MGGTGTGQAQDTLQLVRQFFTGRAGVMAVYLFGSRADGRARPGSDLDVAVLFDDDAVTRDSSPLQRARTLCWAEELGRLCGIGVDMIDLGAAGLVLTHEVLLRGVRVLESDVARVRSFEARALVAYLDFLPIEHRFATAAIRAVRQAARW